MNDPRFQSVHLDGVPRRELFRQARTQLNAACGMMTLAGDLQLLGIDARGDAPTRELPAGKCNPNASYFIRDGETLHKLALGVNSVGRMPDNNVVILDEHISRRHCAVVVHSDGRLEVHDIASKNGTLLNGLKIHGPTRVNPGDVLQLCGRKLTLVEGEAAVVPAA